MQDKSKSSQNSKTSDISPANPQRRRLLAGASVLGLSTGLLPSARAFVPEKK